MPFAIEMYLDPVSAEVVQQVWRQLAEETGGGAVVIGRARPHVTLATCERLDMVAGKRALAEFAATTSPLTVRFASIGLFATDPAVVFLAPVVTDDMLALHRRFHERFRAFAVTPGEYYLPGQWVPHCTLAERIAPAAVPQVVGVCRRISLPLRGRLETVGIFEFPTTHRHAEFPFAE